MSTHSKKVSAVATLFVIGFFMVVPVAAHAAAPFYGPIVPPACNCPGTAAAYGCVILVVNEIIQFAITLGVIVATLVLVYAGFTWVTSASNSEGRSKAKNMLINVAIGLVIVLTAWLVVDYIFSKFGSGNYPSWNSILADNGVTCIQITKPTAIANPVGAWLNSENASNPNQSSTTGIPASANQGTDHLKVQAAISFLQSHYSPSSGTGHCLSAIQYAFQAGGMSLSCPSGYAGQCNGSLQSLGFQSIGTVDPNPQPGDIAVIQHTAGNRIGHITMFTGSNWTSDFVQSNSEQPPGNPYPASEFGGIQYWRP